MLYLRFEPTQGNQWAAFSGSKKIAAIAIENGRSSISTDAGISPEEMAAIQHFAEGTHRAEASAITEG